MVLGYFQDYDTIFLLNLLCNLKQSFLTVDNYLWKNSQVQIKREKKTMVLGDWGGTGNQAQKANIS